MRPLPLKTQPARRLHSAATMQRLISVSLCGFALACSPAAPPPTPALPCEAPSLKSLEVPLGGRAVLELPAGSRVTSLEVTSSGNFTARRLDATRFELKAPYDATTATVKLALQCGETSGTGELTASTRAPKWTALSQWTDGTAGKPPNREYGNMWLDGPDRLMVYGGFHYRPMQFTASTDLWSFDLKTLQWSPLQSANAAPEFMGGRMLPLPDSRELLFLGGMDRNFSLPPHLERFDPATLTWTALQAQGAPAFGDYQAGVVYDSKRSRFLSVCGQSAMVHCKVTSLTEPGGGAPRWDNVAVASGPSPAGRAGHFFTYDAPNDRVIIFAGMSNGILGDTWSLELAEEPARWVRLHEGTPELTRRNGAWALDEANHRFIVWGGTPDGSTASSGVLFLDLDRGHELWWKVEPQGGAPDRASAMAVFDAPNRRLIGGFGNSSSGSHADLWSLEF